MFTFMNRYQPEGQVFRLSETNPQGWETRIWQHEDDAVVYTHDFPLELRHVEMDFDGRSVTSSQPRVIMLDPEAETAADWAIEHGFDVERPGATAVLLDQWGWMFRDRQEVARAVACINTET